MSIPGSASPLFFQTAAGAAGFSLQKSVRFNNDDSAYLNRTPIVGGNRKIFTYSTWVKRSDISDATNYALFSAGTSSYNIFGFRSDGRVRLEGNAPSMDMHTLGRLRDPSAWYHIVFAIDTTQATASNRVKIYINGVQQDLGSSTYPAQNGEFSVNDNSAVHQIGRYSTSRYFDGYMASTVFIDGSQEDCTSFGEFDDNGVWQAIDVSGLTFGTNGFHLFDFANESGIGNDSSGNDNDFTTNNLTSQGGSQVRTTELSVNHASGSVASQGNAFDAAYISARINTSTFAVTNTAWLGAYANGYAELRWIPVGGYAVSSSLRVYFGVYSNAAASSTLTVTYTDSTTESSSQFTSGSNNWMTLFTASNAAGKTIQKVEISNPSSTNVQFGGFVVDGEIVESLNIGTDVLRDVPTNGAQSDTGAGGEVSGNYATWNPLFGKNVLLENGNLEAKSSTSGAYAIIASTLAMTSGKYYMEYTYDKNGGNYITFGVSQTNRDGTEGSGVTDTSEDFGFKCWSSGFYAQSNGSNQHNYSSSIADGDILSLAFDADAGKLWVAKNGTWMTNAGGTGDPANGNNPDYSSLTYSGGYFFMAGPYVDGVTNILKANFGQKTWAYAAPSGFKALNTASLPTPTIADGSDHFDAVLYSGNGSGSGSQTISGLSFSPDFTWLKSRSSALHHRLFDTVLGPSSALSSNLSGSSDDLSSVFSFTNDGFTVTDDSNVAYNRSGRTYVGWNWDAGSSTASNTDGSQTSQVRVNQTAGFSIATFDSANGYTQFTYGHGLNAAPEFVIHKFRSTNSNWYVYHAGLGQPFINLNDASGAGSNQFTTAPTSSIFTYPAGLVVGPNEPMVAYSFTSVEGYSAFGAYSGNGSSDGPFIYTGFRIAWLLIRRSNGSANWYLVDSTRDPDNTVSLYLKPNTNSEEIDTNDEGTKNYIDFLSNGFKLKGTEISTNASQEYIYAAFAENPFQANGGLAR